MFHHKISQDVIALGGVIAKQPSQTTHLVVDKIERTAKLLKCISTCEYIVHVKWLIDSKISGRFCGLIFAILKETKNKCFLFFFSHN